MILVLILSPSRVIVTLCDSVLPPTPPHAHIRTDGCIVGTDDVCMCAASSCSKQQPNLMTIRATDLTQAQWRKFYDHATANRTSVPVLLSDGAFMRDVWMPGAITGVLPWCGLYGLMEPDGTCHT